MDPEVPGSSPGGGTISAGNGHPFNAHARFAARAAALLGLRFETLDEDGYLFAVAGDSGRAAFASGSASPYALNTAAAMSLARDKAFAADALSAAGVAHVPGRLFFANARHAAFRRPGREPEDALRAAAGFAYPVFAKPVSGSRGDFAEIIASPAGFADWLKRVGERHDAVLVQPLVQGTEHRVLILNGKALCAYEKTPLTLRGDGVSPLAALTAAARAHAKPTTATLAPPEQTLARDEAGRLWAAADIPPKGARLAVLGPQNRSAGGDAKAVLAPAPPALAAIGEAAAAALGLAFAGVDVFDRAHDLSDLCVIEANASPALLTLEAHGRIDLIDRIWTANLKAALR